MEFLCFAFDRVDKGRKDHITRFLPLSLNSISNKRQSKVAIKLTIVWIHSANAILDWRMKNGAVARITKIIYGVSIGELPLQVAKT